MSKRIKMVKFYQGITVGASGVVTSFQPDENVSDKVQAKGFKAELQDKGVYLISKTGETLVPWNNIAFIQFEDAPDKVEVKKSK